jgi:hypothetical protein
MPWGKSFEKNLARIRGTWRSRQSFFRRAGANDFDPFVKVFHDLADERLFFLRGEHIKGRFGLIGQAGGSELNRWRAVHPGDSVFKQESAKTFARRSPDLRATTLLPKEPKLSRCAVGMNIPTDEDATGRVRERSMLGSVGGKFMDHQRGRTLTPSLPPPREGALNPMSLTDHKANSTTFQTCGTLLIRRHPPRLDRSVREASLRMTSTSA